MFLMTQDRTIPTRCVSITIKRDGQCPRYVAV